MVTSSWAAAQAQTAASRRRGAVLERALLEQGGDTRFPQLDVSIQARRGRLLMFPPYWMYQHEGMPPVSGDKYILSTYLLFIDPRNPNAQGKVVTEG